MWKCSNITYQLYIVILNYKSTKYIYKYMNRIHLIVFLRSPKWFNTIQ